ncbi:MAG: sulfotransferase [Sulfitobacter sp.]
MSSIVLHIGAPKTGSTYIQRMLQSAPDIIRGQGVYYPVLPQVAQMAGNAKLLASSMLGHVTPSFRRAFPDIDPMALDPADIARDLLKDWKPDLETLVLSAETFMPDHAARLHAILPQDADIKVVMFVRRQDLWFESYFNQLTKTGNIRASMDQFLDDVLRNENGRYCTPDWYAQWRQWVDVFGTCEVVFFDAVRQDLYGAFLNAAGLPILEGLPKIEAQQVSMTSHHLAYLLDIMRDRSGEDYEKARVVCLRTPSKDAPKVSFVTPDQRRVIQNTFEHSNQQLIGALGVSPVDAQITLSDSAANFMTLEAVWNTPYFKCFKAACDLDGTTRTTH